MGSKEVLNDVSLDAPGKRIYSVAEKSLSVILLGAIILTIAQSFGFGTERRHDKTVDFHGAHFLLATCAVVSHEKYNSGRYVCTAAAHRDMQAAGLDYEEATLARIGKTLPELGRDTAFLNNGLNEVFQGAREPNDGGVQAVGWGMDGGYADFVELSFRLFGARVESLYYSFFALLSISSFLLCIQFLRRPWALLFVLCFSYALYSFLPHLDEFELYSVTDPRFLSMLAVVPVFHGSFLIAYGLSPTRWRVLLFAPQAVLLAAAVDFRATAYWAVAALIIYCLAVVGFALWRKQAARTALARSWPGLAVLACAAMGSVLAAATTDKRLAAVGGMRMHAFWQPIYYNLQNHPAWKTKYAAQHKGATGDQTTEVAVASYLERHPELDDARNHVFGRKDYGLSQTGYENYTRAALIEFVLNDPRYFVELKYYNAISIVRKITGLLASVWTSMKWQFLVLCLCVAAFLLLQIEANLERLSRLTWITAAAAGCSLMAAGPVWATVITSYAIADAAIVTVVASFLVCVWAFVFLSVLVRERVRSGAMK